LLLFPRSPLTLSAARVRSPGVGFPKEEGPAGPSPLVVGGPGRNRNAPGFSSGGRGEVLFSKENVPPSLPHSARVQRKRAPLTWRKETTPPFPTEREGKPPCTNPCWTSQVSVTAFCYPVDSRKNPFPQSRRFRPKTARFCSVFCRVYAEKSPKPPLLWKRRWKTPLSRCPVPTPTRAKPTQTRAITTSTRAAAPHFEPSIFPVFRHFYSSSYRNNSPFFLLFATNYFFPFLPSKPLIDILRYYTLRQI